MAFPVTDTQPMVTVPPSVKGLPPGKHRESTASLSFVPGLPSWSFQLRFLTGIMGIGLYSFQEGCNCQMRSLLALKYRAQCLVHGRFSVSTYFYGRQSPFVTEFFSMIEIFNSSYGHLLGMNNDLGSGDAHL